jgi:hypothetical protein
MNNIALQSAPIVVALAGLFAVRRRIHTRSCNFEGFARSRLSTKGACVLDVREETFDHLKNFASGSFDLVLRDLRAVLPAEVVRQIQRASDESGVQEAFGIRRELINFKVSEHYNTPTLTLMSSLTFHISCATHEENLPARLA